MADIGSLIGGAGLGGAIGKAVVSLELDTKKYQAEMKGAQATTQTGASSMSSGLSKFGVTGGQVAAAVGVAFVAMAASSIKAFAESQQIMAQTEAVLKSTGGSANITADEIVALSGTLRDLTAVDDEVIQASSNLLLTFRDVRNETGKGNDIFNQSQVAILDMATAMNQGAIPSQEQLKTTTIQLGKALNNPIQGMSALRRVGVSFTEAQVEQITKMQESGDLMGAQKVILAELSKEFGGAAEAAGDTFAGKMAILNSKFGDVQETIGAALVPALEALADAALAAVPVIELLGKTIQFLPLAQMGESIDQAKERVEGSVPAWKSWIDIIADSVPVLGKYVNVSGDATEATEDQENVISSIAKTIKTQYVPSIAAAGKGTVNTRGDIVKFAHMTGAQLQDWKKKTHEAIHGYIFDLSNLSRQSGVTREDFVRAHRAMEARATEMAQTLKQISKEKWINDDYIRFLSDQGPGFLVAFGNLNERQQRRMQGHWLDSTREMDNAGRGVQRVIEKLNNLDRQDSRHNVEIHYKYVNFDPSKPGM